MTWDCRCGARFRSPMAEARHRHNFPTLCKIPKRKVKALEWLDGFVETIEGANVFARVHCEGQDYVITIPLEKFSKCKHKVLREGTYIRLYTYHKRVAVRHAPRWREDEIAKFKELAEKTGFN